MTQDSVEWLPEEPFSLADTLLSGQTFRWQPFEEGFLGVAEDRVCYARQEGRRLVLQGVWSESDGAFWRNYFDVDRSYALLRQAVCRDAHMKKALAACGGIRLLRQSFWETVISFILSANNNIPRISGMIERLCRRYGKPLGCFMGRELYGFPSPEALAGADRTDLRAQGLGYRDRYVKETAQRFASGAFDLKMLEGKDRLEARKILMTLPGVGAKVADCILLFGAGRQDAFPVDTWVRKVMCRLYFDGADSKTVPVRQIEAFAAGYFPDYAGYAQQVLFHYIRNHINTKEEE